MDSYDNIFDIFEDVLSAEVPVFSAASFPDPVAEISSTPVCEQVEMKEEPQTEEQLPEEGCTAHQGWVVHNLREDITPSESLCLIKVRSRDDEDTWNTVPVRFQPFY